MEFSYYPTFTLGFVLGQGVYMRLYEKRSWRDTMRHIVFFLVVTVPMWWGVIWLLNHITVGIR